MHGAGVTTTFEISHHSFQFVSVLDDGDVQDFGESE